MPVTPGYLDGQCGWNAQVIISGHKRLSRALNAARTVLVETIDLVLALHLH
jgi:hypothetical protein